MGPDGPTPGCTPRAGDRIHLPGQPLREALRALNGLLPPDVAITRPPTGARRVQPSLRGPLPGIPVHHLERAAQPASGAHGARGAGAAGHRRDGAGRVGPRGPARLQRLRGGGPQPVRTVHRSGSGGTGRCDDRRAGRRVPARHGPAHRRRPARGRHGQDGGHGGPGGARGRDPALDGAAAPAQGLASGASSSGGRPGNANGEHEER